MSLFQRVPERDMKRVLLQPVPLAKSLAPAIGSCPSLERCLSPFAKLSTALVGNCRLPQPQEEWFLSENNSLTKEAFKQGLQGVEMLARLKMKFVSPGQTHWEAELEGSAECPEA